MTRAKKLALMAGAFPVAAALALASTSMASAYVTGAYATAANIRTAPSTSAASLGIGYPGQVAYVYCLTTGTSVNGNPYWLKNTDETTGVGPGYTSANYIGQTGPGAPGDCLFLLCANGRVKHKARPLPFPYTPDGNFMKPDLASFILTTVFPEFYSSSETGRIIRAITPRSVQ